MKTFGKLLLVLALALGAFAIWRGFFYFPNGEDAQLTAQMASGSVSGTPNLPDAGGEHVAAPSRLQIPKLGIDAKVQALGLTRKGNMAAPNNFTDVSWYKLGTIPGTLGSAVIAGHEDNAAGLDGVFKHLDQLAVGDDIYIVTESGEKLHFRVTDMKVYPYDLDGPALDNVFNAHDAARLNLITCSGHWVDAIKTNDKRLVVFTELVK